MPQPTVLEAVSRSGAGIHVAPMDTVPLAQAYLAYRVDTADFEQLAELEAFQAHWLATPQAIAFQRLGGNVHVSRSQQWLTFGANGPKELLAHAVDLAVSAALPVETDEEQARLATAQARRQAESVAMRPASVTQHLVAETMYGTVPPLMATRFPDGMWDAVTSDGIATCGPRQSADSPAHLVVCGDLDPDRALDTALQAMDATRAGAPHGGKPMLPEDDGGTGGTVEYTRPDWAVAHLRYAYPALDKQHELFPASLVAGTALGYFSGRINSAVRERLGLAYRTSAPLSQHLDRDMAFIEADLAPGSVAEADREIVSILDDLLHNGLDPEELEAVVTYMTRQYGLALSSQSGLALTVLSYVTFGLGVPQISRLPGRISEVSADAVTEAARVMYGSGPAAKVVVRPPHTQEGS